MMTFALLATTAFCKIATPTSLTYAPDLLWPSWKTPTTEQYLAQGWLHNRVQKPETREGYYVTNTTYVAQGDAVVARYAYAPIPAPVRRWTPLSIKRAATALGRWDALKGFLQSANAYDDFVMAQYEAEDDAQFVALMAAARAQFGDAWVDEILNSAEVE